MNALPEMGQINGHEHGLPVRVYYEDTDFSGVVYHAAYLKFMERGRTEALRATGTGHQDLLLQNPPLAFVVRGMQLSFHAPARIDDALLVRTRFFEATGARMRAEQTVDCADQVLVSAVLELACIDLDGRPKRIPKDMLAKMKLFLCDKPT
ncbi:MAG: tol-pal system-associated acyl-CoA thioesterase [Robiginitomaculum sp.]|nr:tol-pal system-associated acyl-CoA thioesterase [Robiginitomaculum sp.]